MQNTIAGNSRISPIGCPGGVRRACKPQDEHHEIAGAGIHDESGATLVIALIFLLLLTIIGITAVTTSSLQEKMAGNVRDQQVAFESAESALRNGETWLSTLSQAANSKPVTNSSLPCMNESSTPPVVCAFGTPGDFMDTTHNANYGTTWWDADAVEYGVAGTQEITQAYQDPRYVIEFRSFVPDNLNMGPGYNATAGSTYYRVTAYGWGGTESAVSIIQSNYLKRY
ncbi:MAG: pilus assembly PilX family protein [Acidiferrobacterales bacterium]